MICEKTLQRLIRLPHVDFAPRPASSSACIFSINLRAGRQEQENIRGGTQEQQKRVGLARSGSYIPSPSVENPSGGASVAYFFYSPLLGYFETFQYSHSMRGGILYSASASVYFRIASSWIRSILSSGKHRVSARWPVLSGARITKRPTLSLLAVVNLASAIPQSLPGY